MTSTIKGLVTELLGAAQKKSQYDQVAEKLGILLTAAAFRYDRSTCYTPQDIAAAKAFWTLLLFGSGRKSLILNEQEELTLGVRALKFTAVFGAAAARAYSFGEMRHLASGECDTVKEACHAFIDRPLFLLPPPKPAGERDRSKAATRNTLRLVTNPS